MSRARRNEPILRLIARREICDGAVNLETTHVCKLANLTRPGRREDD
jgi:hypothetical protein